MRRRCVACPGTRACDAPCRRAILRAPRTLAPRWLAVLAVLASVWVGVRVVDNVTGAMRALGGGPASASILGRETATR